MAADLMVIRIRLRGWAMLRAFLLRMGLWVGIATVLTAVPPKGGVGAEPLAPPSGPRGKTLFATLGPEQTGIVAENAYADPKMWSDHYQEFVYGAIGSGIAAGDFDNDGRPDVFAVNKTGQSRLFRNGGGWSFADVTEKAGLLEAPARSWLTSATNVNGGRAATEPAEAWKQGATFADVNNDGWLDLYVCRFNAPNLLFVNQRDGTFKEEGHARGLDLVDASTMAAFADYDRDGWLDVYVQTNMLDAAGHPKGQRDHLFRNKGDGWFEDVSQRAGISGESCGHSITWWDFDADGWPDAYVANDYDVPDRLYRNNRDGTFTDVIRDVVPHAPYYAMGADQGDVNNDGRIDFLVADMAASSHEKDYRGMAGSRERAQLEPADGALPQYMRSALFLNTGAGRMREVAQQAGVSATDWTWSVRFEDLDNDGRVDLHITNGMVREFHNADILSRIMSAESVPESWKLVRAMPPMRERNFAFRNRGDLTFEDVGAVWGLDLLGVSFGAAFADFDGDGDLDLVHSNFDAGPTVLRNDSDTGHRLLVSLRGARSNRFGVGAKVTLETAAGIQTKSLVLARGYNSSSDPVLHFGLGGEATAKRLTIEWPSGVVQQLENVAAAQRLTVVETGEPGPTSDRTAAAARRLFEDITTVTGLAAATVESAADEPSIQPFIPWRFNRAGPALVAADLDGDRREDLVLGGNGRTPARLLRGRAGAFVAEALPARIGPNELPDGPIGLLDVDGNGALDVFLTKTGASQPAGAPSYQPQLLLNDGSGAFQPAPPGAIPALPMSAGAVVVFDADRDGRSDVFLGGRSVPGRYPMTPRSALLLNRGGRLEDATANVAQSLREIGMVTAARAADMDGDGWDDLVIALDWDTVRLLHNDAGRGFSDWTERTGLSATGRGWWRSLAIADVNGDRKLDVIAGNIGLNTRYSASREKPSVLFHGPLVAGSQAVALEGYYEGDKLYPWVSRNLLGTKVPPVLQRFRRNDVFARATLEEIVGAEALGRMRRVTAEELRSGVFLSRADGTYGFVPFPPIAQISPTVQSIVADLDGDADADVFLVQNSSMPLPAIGNFDGGIGQLLRGDGRGNFEPVEPLESGLVVPGSASGAAAADLDNDGTDELVISREGAPLMAFRRRDPGPGRLP